MFQWIWIQIHPEPGTHFRLLSMALTLVIPARYVQGFYSLRGKTEMRNVARIMFTLNTWNTWVDEQPTVTHHKSGSAGGFFQFAHCGSYCVSLYKVVSSRSYHVKCLEMCMLWIGAIQIQLNWMICTVASYYFYFSSSFLWTLWWNLNIFAKKLIILIY